MSQGKGIAGALIICLSIVINVVLAIISICLLTIGIILKYGLEKMLIDYAEAKYNEKFEYDLDLSNLINPYSIILIIVGSILLGLSIFGFIGICFKKKILLLLYIIMNVLFFALQIIVLIVYLKFTSTIKENVEKKLIVMTKENYSIKNNKSLFVVTWNIVMEKKNCCGVSGYKDFIKIPPICCIKPVPCKYKQGCFDGIIDEAMPYKNIIFGILIAFIVIEALIIAYCMYLIIRKEE
ncbi:hypothetical protein A3Q56_06330 [Intoshia linei]|uniref:Tetraspanin n=1 Tax=Intoshia linei TaxID=1819745 RepID=A0A177AV88_9BILA|nr:hypothetical protein A3Q56_06330 [Intoshia linei]